MYIETYIILGSVKEIYNIIIYRLYNKKKIMF